MTMNMRTTVSDVMIEGGDYEVTFHGKYKGVSGHMKGLQYKFEDQDGNIHYFQLANSVSEWKLLRKPLPEVRKGDVWVDKGTAYVAMGSDTFLTAGNNSGAVSKDYFFDLHPDATRIHRKSLS
jgi:hypothetical protein